MKQNAGKNKLPKYVSIKDDHWYVRRTYKSAETYSNGTPKRIEVIKICRPETPERAEELSKEIEASRFIERVENERPKSVSEYLEIYLEKKKRSVTRRTHQGYVELFDRYVKGSPLSKIGIADTRIKDVQDFFDGLERKGVSGAMAHKVRTLLSMAFRQAVIWEDLKKNPAKGVILPKKEEKESIALTKEEVKRLIPVLRADPNCLPFELNLETGLRPQEILALPWRNVDLTKRRLSVTQSLSDELKGGGFEIKEPKTKASRRTVSFSPYMRDRLIEHQKLQKEYLKELREKIKRPNFGTPGSGHYEARKTGRARWQQILANFQKYDLVFPSEIGLPQPRHNINLRSFKPALEKAGIDVTRYSFRHLRHTNASIMAEQVGPKRLQKHLGHERIETSLKFYVHVDDGSEEEMSDKFAAELY